MPLVRKERSPFWWYDFRFQGRRYRASTGEKTKAAAGTVEAAVLTRLTQGVSPGRVQRTPTLAELASGRFLPWVERSHQLAPKTRAFYRNGMRLLGFTPLANMPIDRITTESVECTTFVRHVIHRATGQPTGEILPCSPAYTNQAIRTLKVLLGKALEWKLLLNRPRIKAVKTVGRDRMIDHRAEILLQRSLQQLTAQGSRNRNREQAYLILVILQDTGMRPDEVFPMRIGDIHWAENRIWIPRGKTANARRFVGLSDRMRAMLEPWCSNRTGFVFPSKTSQCGHVTTIARSFRQARIRAGLDAKLVPYSARHTFGTYALEATGNLFAVSKSMGHANVQSMTPYQHPDTSSLNAAINQRNREKEQNRFALEATFGPTHGPTSQMVQ